MVSGVLRALLVALAVAVAVQGRVTLPAELRNSERVTTFLQAVEEEREPITLVILSLTGLWIGMASKVASANKEMNLAALDASIKTAAERANDHTRSFIKIMEMLEADKEAIEQHFPGLHAQIADAIPQGGDIAAMAANVGEGMSMQDVERVNREEAAAFAKDKAIELGVGVAEQIAPALSHVVPIVSFGMSIVNLGRTVRSITSDQRYHDAGPDSDQMAAFIRRMDADTYISFCSLVSEIIRSLEGLPDNDDNTKVLADHLVDQLTRVWGCTCSTVFRTYKKQFERFDVAKDIVDIKLHRGAGDVVQAGWTLVENSGGNSELNPFEHDASDKTKGIIGDHAQHSIKLLYQTRQRATGDAQDALPIVDLVVVRLACKESDDEDEDNHNEKLLADIVEMGYVPVPFTDHNDGDVTHGHDCHKVNEDRLDLNSGKDENHPRVYLYMKRAGGRSPITAIEMVSGEESEASQGFTRIGLSTNYFDSNFHAWWNNFKHFAPYLAIKRQLRKLTCPFEDAIKCARQVHRCRWVPVDKGLSWQHGYKAGVQRAIDAIDADERVTGETCTAMLDAHKTEAAWLKANLIRDGKPEDQEAWISGCRSAFLDVSQEHLKAHLTPYPEQFVPGQSVLPRAAIAWRQGAKGQEPEQENTQSNDQFLNFQ